MQHKRNALLVASASLILAFACAGLLRSAPLADEAQQPDALAARAQSSPAERVRRDMPSSFRSTG
jgi:hypothetical protein